MAGKPKKKPPKWFEERMERSRRFRKLIERNNETIFAARLAREREQRGEA